MINVLFAVANMVIAAGYGYVAFFVAPHFKIESRVTRLAGAVFFVTCGLTHFHMATHAWVSAEGVGHPVTWYGLLNHLVQAVAVWLFVTGLYRQYALPKVR